MVDFNCTFHELYINLIQTEMFVCYRREALCMYGTRLWQTIYRIFKPLQTSCSAHTFQALRVQSLWQDISPDIHISNA